MTPQQEHKRVQRALRVLPVEAIAPSVAAYESEGTGLWCLVANELSFVPADGGTTVTNWDDTLEYAQFRRWVEARPERVHGTHEAAVAFVRAALNRLPPEQ